MNITWPTKVTFMPPEDCHEEDMDSEDEESISGPGFKAGMYMEPEMVESFEHLRKLLKTHYKGWSIVEDDIREAYEQWLENKVR